VAVHAGEYASTGMSTDTMACMGSPLVRIPFRYILSLSTSFSSDVRLSTDGVSALAAPIVSACRIIDIKIIRNIRSNFPGEYESGGSLSGYACLAVKVFEIVALIWCKHARTLISRRFQQEQVASNTK
jgi:hypothetical protein